MMQHAFVTGARKDTTHWTKHDPLPWGDFVEWLALDRPARYKNCGGYVVGEFQGTVGHGGKNPDPTCDKQYHRNKRAVLTRSMVTLDADSASSSFLVDVMMELDGVTCAAYTTWSHTPEAPRWRLLVPLSREVSPEEYRLVAKALVAELGVTQFDPSTHEAERVMFRPSTQDPDDYRHVVVEGKPLDPEEWLLRADELGIEQDGVVGNRGEVIDKTYDQLTPEQKIRAAEHVEVRLDHWRGKLAEAAAWPEEQKDEQGRGWELLLRDCAYAVGMLAVSPWTSLDEDHAELEYHGMVPEEMSKAVGNKLDAATWAAVKKVPADIPPWEEGDFDVWSEEAPVPVKELLDDYQPWDIASDLQLGKRVAREYLMGRYLAWGKDRWALWDGRRWDINVTDDRINGDVREALLHIRRMEMKENDKKRDKEMLRAGSPEAEKAAVAAHTDRMRVIQRLSKSEVLNNAKKLARPDLAVRLEEFDGPETADLLNAGNGVVDLRTGELMPHDPSMKFTKLTSVNYVPRALHRDWDRCLAALPDDAGDWVQRKLGQASTGHSPTDEIIMFLRGGGENGKTTFLLGVRQALGDYYTTVPSKVLNPGRDDHSTELMPLKGARLAVIEELPGGDWLTGTQIKTAEGSETGMIARYTGQDNVTWIPSHALVATTNHVIQVSDTDHGTRRRLADVYFSKTFVGVERDPELKVRMKEGKQGQHEAVLAWLVEGAVAAYAQPLEREHMPVSVRADTDKWLVSTNPAEEFLTLALVYKPGCSVLSKDVYKLYKQWAIDNGRRVLSDVTFWERAKKASIFTMEDVQKTQTRDYDELVSISGGEQRNGPLRVVTCVAWSEEYHESVLGAA